MDERTEYQTNLSKLADLMDESFNYQLGFNDMESGELLEYTGNFLFGNTEYDCDHEKADIIQIKELYKYFK